MLRLLTQQMWLFSLTLFSLYAPILHLFESTFYEVAPFRLVSHEHDHRTSPFVNFPRAFSLFFHHLSRRFQFHEVDLRDAAFLKPSAFRYFWKNL